MAHKGLGIGIGALLAAAAGVALFSRKPAPPPGGKGSPPPPGGTKLAPYVDPNQMAVPMGFVSFLRQPYRGWLMTTPANKLQRLGVQFTIPNDADPYAAALMLRRNGITDARIEMGWGSFNYDETDLVDSAQVLKSQLKIMAVAGIRPWILIDFHDQAPCPMSDKFTVATAAAINLWDTIVQLAPGLTTIIPNRTGVLLGPLPQASSWVSSTDTQAHDSFFDDNPTTPGLFITSYNPTTGAATLSRPFPYAGVAAGAQLTLVNMKYLPFSKPGSQNWQDTVNGWLKYVAYLTELLPTLGVTDWTFEIFNEATFGYRFMDITWYYSPPPDGIVVPPNGDDGDLENLPDPTYNPGPLAGSMWHLAAQTVQQVKNTRPNVEVVWGFTNVSLLHTVPANMPTGIAGNSFHPYGEITDIAPNQVVGGTNACVDGTYVPTYSSIEAESRFALWVQTMSAFRGWAPAAVGGLGDQTPPNTPAFHHYSSEYGTDYNDPRMQTCPIWRAKAKHVLRSILFWYNKGVERIYYYDAYDGTNDLDMGLLGQVHLYAQGGPVPSPPLLAWMNLQKKIAGAVDNPIITPLGVASVTAYDAVRYMFPPSGYHPGLRDLDAVVFAPYQVTAGKRIAAVYILTQDFPKDWAPASFGLELTGVSASAQFEWYDPLADQVLPSTATALDNGNMLVQVQLVDYPRLLTVQQ